MPTDLPLLLVAHGSREPAATRTTEAVAVAVQARLPHVLVSLAHVDNTSPSVRHALADIPARPGAREPARTGAHEPDEWVVLPLLLTPATHSKTDIPGAIREARAAGRRLRYGRPLGPHPTLVRAVADQVRTAGGGDDSVVILAAGGAADPDANADVTRVSRLLMEMGGFHAVDTAFITTTRPSVAEVVARWTRLDEGPIVVAPYLLTPGFLADRCRRTAAPAVVADVLGAHPAVADVAVERYREALTGDIRMNCDTCMYRTLLPGREKYLAAPQVPHTHPDDRR